MTHKGCVVKPQYSQSDCLYEQADLDLHRSVAESGCLCTMDVR